MESHEPAPFSGTSSVRSQAAITGQFLSTDCG